MAEGPHLPDDELPEDRVKVVVRQVIDLPLNDGAIQGTFITFDGLKDGREHFAIALGEWKERPTPLVRIHSECLTGDVFRSGRCDCGRQLESAVIRLNDEGGILIYMRQEGRGIGLYNKLDAYALQDCGYDTYEANQTLGLADDLRDYRCAAQMLDALGIRRINLLSNNPDKPKQLRALGIAVRRMISTDSVVHAFNRSYLQTKVRIKNHKISLGG